VSVLPIIAVEMVLADDPDALARPGCLRSSVVVPSKRLDRKPDATWRRRGRTMRTMQIQHLARSR
jgi:hypothetical protein